MNVIRHQSIRLEPAFGRRNESSMASKSPSDPLSVHAACLTFSDPFVRRNRRASLTLSAEQHPWALLRGELLPSQAVPALWASGREETDVVWTTLAVLCLVSERFVNLVTEASLTGWSLFPVSLGASEKTYHGLGVHGRCGPVSYWRPSGDDSIATRELWKMRFDPSSWDGSDFFLPTNSGSILVTDSVQSVLESNGITNLEFKRFVDVEVGNELVRSVRSDTSADRPKHWPCLNDRWRVHECF